MIAWTFGHQLSPPRRRSSSGLPSGAGASGMAGANIGEGEAKSSAAAGLSRTKRRQPSARSSGQLIK
jgi:hypothetical protein